MNNYNYTRALSVASIGAGMGVGGAGVGVGGACVGVGGAFVGVRGAGVGVLAPTLPALPFRGLAFLSPPASPATSTLTDRFFWLPVL